MNSGFHGLSQCSRTTEVIQRQVCELLLHFYFNSFPLLLVRDSYIIHTFSLGKGESESFGCNRERGIKLIRALWRYFVSP